MSDILKDAQKDSILGAQELLLNPVCRRSGPRLMERIAALLDRHQDWGDLEIAQTALESWLSLQSLTHLVEATRRILTAQYDVRVSNE